MQDGAGAGMMMMDDDYVPPDMPDYDEPPPDAGVRQRKRARRSAKLDACTQIPKDEFRKWVRMLWRTC